MIASLVSVIAAILIAGVVVWALDALPGIDPTFKQVARILVIAILVIYAIITILSLFGLAPAWRG